MASNPMTLEELRGLAERATTGPWRRGNGGMVYNSGWTFPLAECPAAQDACFIMRFNPQLALCLLDCVDSLKCGLAYLQSCGYTASKDEGEPEYQMMRDFMRTLSKLEMAGVSVGQNPPLREHPCPTCGEEMRPVTARTREAAMQCPKCPPRTRS